jgi:lipid A 3-O-deacylase
MDGTMAALVLGAALLDMGFAHCPTGCLAPGETPARWSISTGAAIFQDDGRGAEIYIRRDAGVRFGPFQPTVGASLTSEGAAWVGGGALYTLQGPQAIYLQGHIMPGLYRPGGGGPDLGGSLQFRSGLEVGYETASGLRLGLAVDHRSNAEFYGDNPGLETVQFRVSFPAF